MIMMMMVVYDGDNDETDDGDNDRNDDDKVWQCCDFDFCDDYI